jgi:hypothetical protein
MIAAVGLARAPGRTASVEPEDGSPRLGGALRLTLAEG